MSIKRAYARRLFAPLLLTGYAVVVTVHLCAGAVLQEVRRFGTGSHLRTVDSTIALESTFWDRPHGCWDLACQRNGRAALILRVAIPTQRNYQYPKNDIFHLFGPKADNRRLGTHTRLVDAFPASLAMEQVLW